MLIAIAMFTQYQEMKIVFPHYLNFLKQSIFSIDAAHYMNAIVYHFPMVCMNRWNAKPMQISLSNLDTISRQLMGSSALTLIAHYNFFVVYMFQRTKLALNNKPKHTARLDGSIMNKQGKLDADVNKQEKPDRKIQEKPDRKTKNGDAIQEEAGGK
ncbi:hypothetical protein ACJX0J_023162 [Zea mays]